MYIIATAIFIIGVSAGGLFGYYRELTTLGILFSIVLGGFAGSSAGALLFTYLYFTGQDDPSEEEAAVDTIIPALPDGAKKQLVFHDTAHKSEAHGNPPGPDKNNRIIQGLKNAVNSITKQRGV